MMMIIIIIIILLIIITIAMNSINSVKIFSLSVKK
jgi:hypothetical protein